MYVLSAGRRPFGRITFLALAGVTIALGLLVHLRGASLGSVARDVAGDALWATMIAWWIGTCAPRAPLMRRSAITYVVCVVVEVSQLLHGPAIDAARATTLGSLVLGSGFDPRDLVAYAGGVMLAALVEYGLRARRD